MLRWRLVSAAVILSILGLAMALDYRQIASPAVGFWLLPFFLTVVGLAAHETLALFAAQGLRPLRWPVYVGAYAVVLATYTASAWARRDGESSFEERWIPLAWTFVAFSLSVALALSAHTIEFDGPGRHLVHAALAVFAIAYVGVCGAFLVALRTFHDNRWGMLAVVSLLVVVKMSDIGAYFTGRLLGRNKLFPKLSPGKTVEGTLGGLVAAALASWACFKWLAPAMIGEGYERPTLVAIALYGVVVGILGVFGDLAESMFKRDSGKKDSSEWLPGLGGVLDVMDSILLSGPAAYVFWGLGWLGP